MPNTKYIKICFYSSHLNILSDKNIEKEFIHTVLLQCIHLYMFRQTIASSGDFARLLHNRSLQKSNI